MQAIHGESVPFLFVADISTEGVACDTCSQFPLTGIRYKCGYVVKRLTNPPLFFYLESSLPKLFRNRNPNSAAPTTETAPTSICAKTVRKPLPMIPRMCSSKSELLFLMFMLICMLLFSTNVYSQSGPIPALPTRMSGPTPMPARIINTTLPPCGLTVPWPRSGMLPHDYQLKLVLSC